MFRLPERTVTFTLEGEEWAGAEITCRLSPIRVSEVLTVGDGQTWNDLIRRWVDLAVVGWNLALPDGEPIPVSFDGLDYLPHETKIALVNAWVEEVSGIPAPLPKRSSGSVSSAPEPAPSLPSNG